MIYKTTIFVPSLMAFVFSIVVAPIASAIGPELGKWTAIVNSRDKGTVFDTIDASTPAWPTIHSAEYISGMKDAERQEQVEFHSIAHAIIQDAKVLLDKKPRQSTAENWRSLESALRLRDSMLRNTGYANLVLADGLNRLGLVFLCKELGSEEQLSPEFDGALSHLITYRVNIDQWASVTREELGWTDEKLKEVEGNPNPGVGLHKLWDRLTDGDNFACPKNMDHLCSDGLLKQRDLSMLLYRYIYSDIAMKRLSLAVQYKKQTADFSLNDGSGKIAKVLPSSGEGKKMSVVATGGVPRVVMTKLPVEKTNLSVGERFLNARSSADDVATLLHMIESGDIDKFMPLYREDILPSPKTGRP